jgi:hypothetical protein
MKDYKTLLLSRNHLPISIRNGILSSELLFSKYYKRNKNDELRELIIHIENSKFSGITICGGEDSLNKMKLLADEFIYIFAGRNKFCFFKLYIKNNTEELISFILIKRKELPEEELLSLPKS